MEKWINLENEIGFDNTRIVAYAVSWCYRPDNWRFLAWYWKLKPDLKQYVDKYFDIYLDMENKERSVNHNTDLSKLCDYFNLPKPVKIYNQKLRMPNYKYIELLKEQGLFDPNYKPKRKKRRW